MRHAVAAGVLMMLALAGCQDDRPEILATTSCAGAVRVETATGPQCALRAGDAGKACTSSEQCESFCLASTAQCAPTKPYFGCFIPLENGKPGVEICVK
jgi:hypothetical protein